MEEQKTGDQSLLIKQDPDIQLIYTLEEGESGECETQMWWKNDGETLMKLILSLCRCS